MYTRAPQRKNAASEMIPEPSIQLPKNYSGNAFTSDGQRTQFSPPHRTTPQSAPPPIPTQKPPLTYSNYAQAEIVGTHSDEMPIPEEIVESVDSSVKEDESPLPAIAPKREGGSIFSSLLPVGAFKNNFPFGHGLGSDELLILGIMLSIYLSGEADSELMMLLAILLFAG